jgi:hypothetical protein
MRAVNPGRGLPRFMIPQQKYFTVRVTFTSVDLEASLRAFSCHKTQFPPDVMLRVSETLKAASMRELPLTLLFPTKMTNDLFDR